MGYEYCRNVRLFGAFSYRFQQWNNETHKIRTMWIFVAISYSCKFIKGEKKQGRATPWLPNVIFYYPASFALFFFVILQKVFLVFFSDEVTEKIFIFLNKGLRVRIISYFLSHTTVSKLICSLTYLCIFNERIDIFFLNKPTR